MEDNLYFFLMFNWEENITVIMEETSDGLHENMEEVIAYDIFDFLERIS